MFTGLSAFPLTPLTDERVDAEGSGSVPPCRPLGHRMNV